MTDKQFTHHYLRYLARSLFPIREKTAGSGLLRLVLMICAATALISIISGILDFGISGLIQRAIDLYSDVFATFFSPLEIWIFARFEFHLYPHWRDIFVLLTLYFFAGARTEFGEYRAGRSNVSTFVFRFTIALTIAFTTAFVLGLVSIDSTTGLKVSLVASIPFIAIALHDLLLRFWRTVFTRANEAKRRGHDVLSFWSYFNIAAKPVSARTLLAVIFVNLALYFIPKFELGQALLLFGLYVLYLAVNQVRLGVGEFGDLQKVNPSESWDSVADRSRGIVIGTNVFCVWIWSIGLLIANVCLAHLGY